MINSYPWQMLNKFPEVKRYGYARLATTIGYTSSVLYERCTPKMKSQIHILKNAGVANYIKINV